MSVVSPKVKNNPHCLVCNCRVGVSTRNSLQIFNKQVQTCSERPVSCIMSQVLDKELDESNVHSLLICKKCYKLFNEVDELELRLAEVKVELVSNYKRTIVKQNNPDAEDFDFIKKDGDKPEGSGETQEITNGDGEKKELPDFDSLEQQLEKIHEGEVKTEKVQVQVQGEVTEIIDDDEEDPQLEEPVDAGAIDNSDDSDYEPPIVLRQGTEELDTTTALLEAAALAEQSLSQDSETGAIQVKIEMDDEDRGRRRQYNKKSIRFPKIKDEVLEPLVERDGNMYACLACDESERAMGEAKAIMVHMKTVHELRVYICDVCGTDFRKRNELSVHLDEHVATEEGDFQCEVCNRIFSNLRLFRIHKRMHYPQSKLWTCDQCGKRYSSRNLLDEHINTHTGVRPYICGTCGKDFASKYTYRAHEKTHEVRPRPFQCSQCPKSFLSQQNLTQHERTHSGIKEYVCHLCGKAFGSPHNLEVHSIVHTGYKPFICGNCGKAFARKAEIRDHERTHTGERPYQCEFCGATFSQRSNLQSHKRATHYDDKRYKCQTCGKGFKRRRLLDYHMKAAHTGERPFKCNVCEATFVYPEHFKKHRRIHTGEKPFLCEVCGKAFNSRDNRNAHRFVHSDKKPYECLVCGMGFMRKPLLYAHMQSQGHLNDTIVVNQPRLTIDDDQIVTVNADGDMEVVEEDISHLEAIEGEEDDDEANADAKLYITELKEHVIIRDSHTYSSSKGAVIIGENLEGDDAQEGVEHLIIDGQVHFASQNDDDSGAEGEELSEGQILTAEDLVGGNTQSIQTSSGQIQLVQIRIPSENGEEQEAWVKIVPE